MIPVPRSLTSLVSLDTENGPKSTAEAFTERLRAIGGLSVEEYLNTPKGDLPPIRYDFGLSNSPWYYNIEPNEDKAAALPVLSAYDQLQNVCKEVSEEIKLQYEYMHSDAGRIHSVLHIIKRESQRTYAGVHKHESQAEAGEDAAQVALRSGAVAYIMSSHDEPAVTPPSEDDEADSSDPVKIIEKCFAQWRSDTRPPQWHTYENGAALRVQLAPRIFRAYSTPENTLSDPKVACAQIAIDSGVLDFIKSSKGQAVYSQDLIDLSTRDSEGNILWVNVEDFLKTLPRPFPEPQFSQHMDRAEQDIMNWYNTIFQEANKYRSTPLKQYFHFLNVKHRHGCVLRIEDPDLDPNQAKTYLVEPSFSKKNKAKLAVCLQAMSEGVGNFFRSYIPADAKITAAKKRTVTSEMHRYASETAWPELVAVSQATGALPTLHYMSHKGKFGCTLKLSIPPSPASSIPATVLNKTGNISRKYTVPNEYASNEDARAAVVCQAAQKGAIQFVKDRGTTPRPGGNSSTSRGPEKKGQIGISATMPKVQEQGQGQGFRGQGRPDDDDLAYGDIEPGEILPEVELSSQHPRDSGPSGDPNSKRKRETGNDVQGIGQSPSLPGASSGTTSNKRMKL